MKSGGHFVEHGDNPFAVMNARLTGDPEAARQRNPQLSPAIEEIILHAIEIQIAAFFLVFWWLSHRGHRNNSGMTKPEIVDTRPPWDDL